MKKIAALFVSLVMMMSVTAPAFAWLAGDKTQSVDLSDAEIIVSGEYANSALSIVGGGRAVYQLYVPFTAVTVDFGYTLKEETANMNFIIDSTEYNMELSGSSYSLTLSPKLKMGEHQIIIKTDKAIDISSVVFNKENVYSEWKIANYETQPALTEYEKAIATAVILSPKSSVIMVNGGKRYVDNDNPRLTPYTENSDIYLPLHSFARAFGLYLEEKENEFVLMKQNYTFHYKDGVMTRQYFSDTPEVIANIAKKIDGKFYMPLRYVAELEGKTLLQRGDMYVVDYPSNAKTILKDVYYNELVNNYNNWSIETKKGNTYYVSTDCVACDDNNGSYEKPFKTIAKACEVAQAGDTVILRGGIYHEQIAPKNNGTASNPIVFKAAEGEEVLLSACAELGKPVGEENGILIYTALTDLGDGRNQIFYQSDNLVAARHPNENTSKNEIPLPEDLSDLWPIQGNI